MKKIVISVIELVEVVLKDCPFCGSNYDQPELEEAQNVAGKHFWVECKYCGCRGQGGPSQEDAVNKWNHRAKRNRSKENG